MLGTSGDSVSEEIVVNLKIPDTPPSTRIFADKIWGDSHNSLGIFLLSFAAVMQMDELITSDVKSDGNLIQLGREFSYDSI